MRRLLAIAAAVVMLVACGEPNVLTRGEVIAKDFDDEDTWTTMECGMYAPRGGCAYWTTTVHSDPASWSLQIENTYKGEVRREWHEVSAGFHDRVSVGQYVDVTTEEVIPR